MKYAIIIPDGAADLPVEELDGRTPLEAAETPAMDRLVSIGRIGTTRNIPPNLPAGSDVAILSLLGYDPSVYYTGRAPLEAAAMDLEIAPQDVVFRCNIVTIIDGIMEDHSAGHISTQEAHTLIDALADDVAEDYPDVAFHKGVSYRHLMTGPFDGKLTTTPPHDIPGEQADSYLPKGRGAKPLKDLIKRSQEIFARSEINAVRNELGENPASSVWLWGQGKMPQLPSFADRFAMRGAAITAVDLIRGLSKLIGWDLIAVQGATGYLDTNYIGKGAEACKALDDYDIVTVHVEAPDEAGHAANIAGKVEAITNIDCHIIGPILDRLREQGEGNWRMLVLPDHPTPVAQRIHTAMPVPFALAGAGVKSLSEETVFSEAAAEASDLHIDQGHNLMEYFLTVR
jgi:2,3-bisphosphoglycerate-independent phosphoglycerate mutase